MLRIFFQCAGQGDRLKEGSLINVSLMNLGRCLEVRPRPGHACINVGGGVCGSALMRAAWAMY
jgi:hypothetical protein